MITLHTFGPNFGLPDPSPFVMKAEVLLKVSGRAYKTDPTGFSKAPKGKLPYIDDDGTVVADSTFIRRHLETKYGIDFDKDLSPAERAAAWAFEKLCEEHLYWGIVRARWLNDRNFNAGPRAFFDRAPAPLRPLIIPMIRRQVRKSLHGQGFGRHTELEVAQLCERDLTAISDFLADKPYLMGATPSGADASVFSFVAGALCERFETPIRDAAASKANLVAYRERGFKLWFPEFPRTK